MSHQQTPPTLRAAIEAIRDELEGQRLNSMSHDYLTAQRLTAALALPDLPQPSLAREEWERIADVMSGASDQSPDWTMDDEIAAKCRTYAEPETGR